MANNNNDNGTNGNGGGGDKGCPAGHAFDTSGAESCITYTAAPSTSPSNAGGTTVTIDYSCLKGSSISHVIIDEECDDDCDAGKTEPVRARAATCFESACAWSGRARGCTMRLCVYTARVLHVRSERHWS